MEINGERVIGASRQTVWDAINDPEILKLCIPGGESVERVSDSEMKAVVMAKIGANCTSILPNGIDPFAQVTS